MEPRERKAWIRRRLPVLLAAGILGIGILYTLFGEVGVLNSYKIYRTQKQLEEENARLREEIADLRKKVEDLRSNPSVIEDIARKDLGLIRKKENVIVLERNKDADPHPPKGRTGAP
ncbi:MAG TPA: hypothetical protein DD658_08255 [Deltaproteobacteria bacterium]|nr:hypothetical protein [Deltaproteobacteria bacterium]